MICAAHVRGPYRDRALLSRAFCIVVDFQEAAEAATLEWEGDSRERKRTLGAMAFLGELYQQGVAAGLKRLAPAWPTAPSARLVAPRAQAAFTWPTAPPEHLGSSPWLQ